MTVVDWILLAVLLVSLALGAWRGLIYELLSVLGWVAAFVLAQWWAPAVSGQLPTKGFAEPIRYAVAFLVVFVGTVFAAGLLSWVARQLIEAVGLRPADRALGAMFGLLRGVVLLLALAVVIGMTPLGRGAWWQDSTGAAALNATLKQLRPVLPAKFGQYLPT